MIGPFQKLESIGKGSFAMVYRGVHVVCRLTLQSPSLMASQVSRQTFGLVLL